MRKRKQLLKQIDRYSQFAMKCILVGIIVLIIVQSLLQINSIRHIIVPTERWEGQRLN